MSPAIEVEEVSRDFRGAGKAIRALDRVSFSVHAGEIVGLLGVNGAGKTTLTKILATLLLPTSGTARILGTDVVRDPRRARIRQSVVLGGDRGLYGQLSARENLRFFGMLSGLEHRELMTRIGPSLERAGLTEAADRKVSAFSRGMRQRLHLAIGMISQPRVLLLDEPTAGLDPAEAERLRDAVARLRDDGVSMLLTSHDLRDVERLASRVIMLDRGRVIHAMTTAEFAAAAGHAATVVLRGTGQWPDVAILDRMGTSVILPEPSHGNWVVTVQLREWSAAVFADLSGALSGAGVKVTGVEVQPVGLEQSFLLLQTASGGPLHRGGSK